MSLAQTLSIAATATALAAAAVSAHAMRDPFEPPAVARAAAPAAAPGTAPAAAAAPADWPTVRHLIQVDGRRYVLDGARRYGVGDRFGGARIECIGDAGVVVRDGTERRLLPMFGGIVKRTAGASDAPAPSCPLSTTSTTSAKDPR